MGVFSQGPSRKVGKEISLSQIWWTLPTLGLDWSYAYLGPGPPSTSPDPAPVGMSTPLGFLWLLLGSGLEHQAEISGQGNGERPES